MIGLYVIPEQRTFPSFGSDLPSSVKESVAAFFKRRSAVAKEAFENATSKAGISAEWREISSSGSTKVADTVVKHGFQAELIIVSQDNEEVDDGVETGFCERIVIESGRPVLLIPKEGQFADVGNHVIAGFNASREAARAIFDALPFLDTSKTTKLVWVDPSDVDGIDGDLPGSEMATTLARRKLNVTAEATSSGGDDAAEVLLKQAGKEGADLIVIGAYGRSRLSEYVFGGVTWTLLKSAPVPVLMSR